MAIIPEPPKKRGRPPGRKKGVPNKITKTARQNILDVFDGVGGVPEVIAWAKRSDDNFAKFMHIYAKVIPAEVHLQAQVGHYDSASELERLRQRAIEVESRRQIPKLPSQSVESVLEAEYVEVER